MIRVRRTLGGTPAAKEFTPLSTQGIARLRNMSYKYKTYGGWVTSIDAKNATLEITIEFDMNIHRDLTCDIPPDTPLWLGGKPLKWPDAAKILKPKMPLFFSGVLTAKLHHPD